MISCQYKSYIRVYIERVEVHIASLRNNIGIMRHFWIILIGLCLSDNWNRIGWKALKCLREKKHIQGTGRNSRMLDEDGKEFGVLHGLMLKRREVRHFRSKQK